MPVFQIDDTVPQSAVALPTPVVVGIGAMANESVEDFHTRVLDILSKQVSEANTTDLLILSVFPFNYPDEAVEVSEREIKEKDATGKKVATGETRVTSKTYGRANKLPLGFVDNDRNPMLFIGKVIAPNPAAEKEALAEQEEE